MTKAVLVYRDVTERQHAEQDQAQQQRELEAILDTITDGVALYDAKGGLVRANAAGSTPLRL